MLIPILLVLLLMSVGVSAALAAPVESGGDTIVEDGAVVNNDVVVLDGDLEIGQGAIVNGDVVVFNGDAEVAGQVNGSLTLFNGDLKTREGAAISGDCVLLNGETRGDVVPGNCTAIENLNMDWGALAALAPKWFNAPPVPEIPAVPDVPNVSPLPTPPVIPVSPDMVVSRTVEPGGAGFFGFMAKLVGVLLSAVLMGFLGLLAASIAPDNLRQIVTVTRNKPVTSGAAGVLTAIAVPSLIVLLIPLSIILTFVCIGLLGFPLMLLLAIGLVVGGLLGWIAVGTVVGNRLFNQGKNNRLTTTAALGTGVLTLGVGLFGLLPFEFLTGLLVFLISAVGLGAVALTQFGMKPYPRHSEPGTPAPDEDPDKVEEVLLTLAPDEIGDIATEK
ncbi:MAG: hypothetical protein R3C44_17390 [Chloroflexota bacterium]